MAFKKSLAALLFVAMSSGILFAATADTDEKATKSPYVNELTPQQTKHENRRSVDSKAQQAAKKASKKSKDKRDFFRKP